MAVMSRKQRVEKILRDALAEEGMTVSMEHTIPEQLGLRRWRWDLAVIGAKIVIDIQGYRYHSRPENQRNDCEKHNFAVSCGYKVLLYPADMVLKPTPRGRIVEQIHRLACNCSDTSMDAFTLSGDK